MYILEPINDDGENERVPDNAETGKPIFPTKNKLPWRTTKVL